MPRDTLIDYFDDLAKARGPFLVYDDGFRIRSHLYTEVARAARGFAARLAEVSVAFGAPMRLTGADYEALAKQVEDAGRALSR